MPWFGGFTLASTIPHLGAMLRYLSAPFRSVYRISGMGLQLLNFNSFTRFKISIIEKFVITVGKCL